MTVLCWKHQHSSISLPTFESQYVGKKEISRFSYRESMKNSAQSLNALGWLTWNCFFMGPKWSSVDNFIWFNLIGSLQYILFLYTLALPWPPPPENIETSTHRLQFIYSSTQVCNKQNTSSLVYRQEQALNPVPPCKCSVLCPPEMETFCVWCQTKTLQSNQSSVFLGWKIPERSPVFNHVIFLSSLKIEAIANINTQKVRNWWLVMEKTGLQAYYLPVEQLTAGPQLISVQAGPGRGAEDRRRGEARWNLKDSGLGPSQPLAVETLNTVLLVSGLQIPLLQNEEWVHCALIVQLTVLCVGVSVYFPTPALTFHYHNQIKPGSPWSP
jgi:hypothetical protein